MSETFVSLVGAEDLINEIERLQIEGTEIGRSRSADALVDATDAPLGPEEIKQLLQIITVAFSTGTAALTFFAKLRSMLQNKAATATVQVNDGLSGRAISVIDGATDVQELVQKIQG
jgi:hypothetical protein